jgi:hypothetical protein
MALALRFKGTPEVLREKLGKIRVACSMQVGQPCEYIYTQNKRIECRKSPDENNRIYVVVKHTNEELIVILPYCIASSFKSTIFDSSAILPDFETRPQVVLRDNQKSDLVKIISMMRERGFCYFKAFPSYGKSIMIAMVISLLKQKAIVVVHGCSIATQARDTYKELLPDLKVYAMDTDKIIPDDADIIVCYYQRLDGSYEMVSRFGTVVLDEVHLLTTAQGNKTLLSLRPKYLFATTATGAEREPITQLFAGKCSIESLSDKKWSITFPKIRSGLNGNAYSSVIGYTTAISHLSDSEPFISTIARMVRYFCSIGKRVIVLTMRIEMRDIMAKNLEGLKISVIEPKDRACHNSDVIISTFKCIGTGFDLKNSVGEDFDGQNADIMIFLGSIKNKSLWYQTSGRGFRTAFPLAIFPQIVDLPVSNKHIEILRRNAKQQQGCTVLDEYGRFLEQFNQPIPISKT